ncbi:hypothetical protein KGM_215699 [Danaus plexippus plexippus]|uniref:Methyltransferase domain-containing protein n=1 Tax=Danaus plexippus plexippus TaxID=278856 RepID=A0A212EKT2_DANPL|nr:hypothetical protein KGM_215699 [Danaus plexippus plexippus]
MNKHEETVRCAIQMCLKVIKSYEWLSDLYVLDFFVDNHWSKLPQCWQNCFNDMDPKDLGNILTGQQSKHMLPLSFLALKKSIDVLSIPRLSSYKSSTNKSDSVNHDWTDNPKFKNLFLKHVKLKKRHEISVMSDFVNNTVKKAGCNAVLDFGSGLGHLIRILSYKYNIQTIGIEMQAKLTAEARKLDLELEYTVKKHLTEEAISKLIRPNHINLILSSLQQLKEIPLDTEKYGLIGLHPCGDLGPLLIKHFVNSEDVKFICIVGCCFMKLSCNKEPCGYPMSQYLKGLNNDLSYFSREIACHAIETYCKRLCNGDYNDLKVHAYRAALEKILRQLDPKLMHMPVRNVKHTNNMTFEEYCAAALHKLSIDPLNSSGVETDLLQWKKVVVLYTLRLAIAPLVETLILLDRVLFILEHGMKKL